MSSWAETTRLVEARADQRCEYCRMHQELQGATVHVEHVIPVSRGGSDDPSNLAWACPGCNLKKADRVEVPDPDTVTQVPLFNPRVDRWKEHFRWYGYEIVGVSAIGRAMLAAFDLNHPRRQRIRQAEQQVSLFPPVE